MLLSSPEKLQWLFLRLFGLRRGKTYDAFSLVEVTLALGIVAFALLSVMALIPVGLSTLGDAKDQTTEAHILSGLAAQISILPFEDVKRLNSDIDFDKDGQPTEVALNRVYKVHISAQSPVYVGEPAQPEDVLQSIKVEIKNEHRSGQSTKTYTLHVAKLR